MSISFLATLQRRHRVLEQEIFVEQKHPSWDDSKIAELKRRKLHIKDKISRLQHDIGALSSRTKLTAMERKKATRQMNKPKSGSWYEGASRSISISKAKPL
jgi:hypothetical protein